MHKLLPFLLISLIPIPPSLFGGEAALMPQPAEIKYAAPAARLPVDAGFTIAITGVDDARLRSAATRLYRALAIRTGIVFSPGTPGTSSAPSASAKLILSARSPAPAIPTPAEDESYTLAITPDRATLDAPTTTGILRGLATLIQLVQQDADGYYLPAVTINDRPRFPWRGLMIDVSRRWHDIGEIKRILDGMALVKLNVLHFHLSDDQGFRIESRTHPELHTLGSDGLYFTQAQILDIIDYAAARAIRVVPEFDIPGHASAWSVSHPGLMSGPPRAAGEPPTADAPEAVWDGTYRIERTWGIFDMVFDPSNEAAYALLSDFLGEMAALFPDPYFHIGGDENNGAQWTASARIQKFITASGLKDNHGLHAYFNTRIAEVLSRNGKTIVGWDEILHPTLPQNALVQSWRGPEGVTAAARAGHPVILSNGYYIDLSFTAADHYLNDPLPAGTISPEAANASVAQTAKSAISPLTLDQQRLVLGGEATMWSEWTTSETIDSRLWPRTAAIAERLWSPQTLRDTADMYRRLAVVSLRLDEAGMQHLRNRVSLLIRLAGDRATPGQLAALRTFSDACEPVKGYRRGRLQRWSNQYDPLTGFTDATIPDSAPSREFNNNVAALLGLTGPGVQPAESGDMGGPSKPSARATTIAALRAQLKTWHDAAHIVAGPLAAQSPRLKEPGRLASGFARSIHIAEAALDAIETGPPKPAGWKQQNIDAIEAATAPNASAVEIPAVQGIKQLIEAAAK